ncbi:MAG: hypothetical protein JJU36_06640 [Phycisphaeraceae bacterium]|nr:hypothetical protein [Phycisphaeraceae bacterium]
MTTHLSSTSQGWLGSIEKKPTGRDLLTALPEAMTDPFTSPARRLEEVVESFRFSRDPLSLLEWATTQTGLADPLGEFTRHELEQTFPFYCHRRDACLRELVTTLKRSGELAVVQRLASETRYPSARKTLLEAIRTC